ncbi:hypothetical protein [Maricaulis maris]
MIETLITAALVLCVAWPYLRSWRTWTILALGSGALWWALSPLL